MCDIGSRIEGIRGKYKGKVWYLTSKDVEKYLRKTPHKCWEDFGGHYGIRTIFPELDELFRLDCTYFREEEGFPVHPKMVSAINSGALDRLHKMAHQEYVRVDKKGRKHGENIFYYDDSFAVKESAEYSHGKKHGKYKEFFEDGSVQKRGFYKKDLPHGEYIELWENGKAKIKGTHKNGLRHGVWQMWHKNGEKHSSPITFVEDAIHGHVEIYDENGNLFFHNYYKAGFLHNGIPCKEYGQKKHDFLVASLGYYPNSGRLRYVGEWQEGDDTDKAGGNATIRTEKNNTRVSLHHVKTPHIRYSYDQSSTYTVHHLFDENEKAYKYKISVIFGYSFPHQYKFWREYTKGNKYADFLR